MNLKNHHLRCCLVTCIAMAGCQRPVDDVPKVYRYDIEALKAASEGRGDWIESAPLQLAFREPRAIASAPNGIIYAAGDRAVIAFGADGGTLWRSQLAEEPRCLAVGADQKIYAGCREHIVVLGPGGDVVGEWMGLGENAVITSVAVGSDRAWVADAGARRVAMFDLGGRLLGYLSPRDPFVVPSPYFDVAAGSSDGVWVVNPGCLRVEHYSKDGRYTSHWGSPSMQPPGFAGCCNPIHIALLPDGGFATAEKGMARIKVYAADGTLDSIVAGPRMFAEDAHGLDLATTTSGDILVLDKEKRSIRRFARNAKKAEAHENR